MKMNEISRYSFATTLANWLKKKPSRYKSFLHIWMFCQEYWQAVFWVKEGQDTVILPKMFSSVMQENCSYWMLFCLNHGSVIFHFRN